MKPGDGPAEVDHRVLEIDLEGAEVVKEIFRLAADEDKGCHLIAQELNAQPDLVKRFGRFHPDTIAYMLRNKIYIGVLEFGRVATDIVDDARVIRRNEEEDIVRVKSFCQPMVDRDSWDKVQRRRNERWEPIRAARQDGHVTAVKQIAPLAQRTSVKYPLTGLVRCPRCNASMRANGSGSASKTGKSYRYYVCPSSLAGSRSNQIYLPERWLFEQVVARLKSRLFPAIGGGAEGTLESGALPDWILALQGEVREALRQRHQDKLDARPHVEGELHDLKRKMGGWLQSLSKSELPVSVRTDIEDAYKNAGERREELESELLDLDRQIGEADIHLQKSDVHDRLKRLREVLDHGSASAVNQELSRHIDRIEVCPGGQVVMHTCKLGLLEGAAALLADSEHPSQHRGNKQNDDVGAGPPPVHSRRRRQRLQKEDAVGCGSVVMNCLPDSRMHFANLSSAWFWVDPFQAPDKTCWAKRHALEVGDLRRQGLTLAKIASLLRVSRPTVRNALKIAKEISAQERESVDVQSNVIGPDVANDNDS